LAEADLVLVVLDAVAWPEAESAEDTRRLLALAEERPHIVVHNKADLAPALSVAAQNGYLRTSALTGEGIAELRAEILRHLGGEDGGQQESGMLTNARHQGLVRESLQVLAQAAQAVQNSIPHEMLLLDLYNALRPLDAITGATTTEDILNLIFSSFCIGK